MRSCFFSAICVMLCLIFSAAADPGATADTTGSLAFEKARIQAGLAKLGVGEGYAIIIGDRCDLVETTAAEMMQRFLAKGSLRVEIVRESKASSHKRILLGRESSLRAIKDFRDTGDIKVRDVSAEDDGFHLRKAGDDIVVAGANPRGVLYGVYAFEDFVNAGASGDLDVKKVPYFRRRGSGLGYISVQFEAELEEFPEAKAAGLSRLGINQMTDQGISGHLSRYVHSDVFPFQAPPDPDYQRKVKTMSALLAKYGIDLYLFIQEPGLDPVAGGFDSYPKEALGRVRPPWGVPNNETVPALCVNSPIAQEHLRNMMRKLVREYPHVKGVQLYNLDIGTWLCTPELCERCTKCVTDSPQNEYNPWESQSKLVTLLADAAHEEDPDFNVRFWCTAHFHGDRFDKMIRATRGLNSLMSAWTGSDRSVMIPDAAERAATCVTSQAVAKERSIPFCMAAEFNNLEVVPTSLSFPFHACDALKKYKRWDVKDLTEIYGPEVAHSSINALVMKEFEWNPDQNTEAFLRDLSRRQFGESAGKLAYASWEAMKKAFDVWNDVQEPPFPLMGSQFQTKMGTAVGGLPPAIVPDGAKTYASTIDTLATVEVWFTEGYNKQKTRDFLAKMQAMGTHLEEAENLAKKAVAEASDQQFIDLCAYEDPNGRPTCRQYAELNYAPMALASSLCRQRCNLIRAYLLSTETEKARASGDAKGVQEADAAYRELVRDDLALQERFLELLTQFSTMKPCLTRTGYTERELDDFITFQKTKIEKTKEFLAG